MSRLPAVYLVDDNEGVRFSVTQQLDSIGFASEAFGTAEAFLDSINTVDEFVPGSCLLLDYGLPGMNGIELQKKLLAKSVSLPVVIVTGYVNPEITVQAMQMCAVDVLVKPISTQKLESAVRAASLHSTASKQLSEAFVFYTRQKRLTERQMRILQLASEGFPNKRIASELSCSIKTIEKHRRQAYSALGVGSTAAMSRAMTLAQLYTSLREQSQKEAAYRRMLSEVTNEGLRKPLPLKTNGEWSVDPK